MKLTPPRPGPASTAFTQLTRNTVKTKQVMKSGRSQVVAGTGTFPTKKITGSRRMLRSV